MCFTNKHIVLFIFLLFFFTNIVSALDASPYAGKVVINEILYEQTCKGLANATINDEFIELYFNDAVDISNWTIADGNVVNEDTDGAGGFSFKFPAGSAFNAGNYVVIWIGNSNDPYSLKNAVNAKAQFYVGKKVMLNDNGDDIWLFDADNKIVDYVAYGSDNAINDQSYLPSGFWSDNAPSGANKGQSISLTPNGKYSNSGSDWELTTSGSALGPTTVDTDNGSCDGNERISSVGRNNNEAADLNVSKIDSPDPVGVRKTLKYTITVKNEGQSEAKDVLVKDLLPNVTYKSSTTTKGSCSHYPSNNTVICSIGLLNKNEDVTILINVTPNSIGEIKNEVQVFSSTYDTNSSNNYSFENTTVKEIKEIHGHIYEDFYPLGVNNGEDKPIEGVKVYLFKDDGNGVLDGGDNIVANTTTNSSGYYNFSMLPGTYFVVVDSKTISTTRGLNSGYTSDRIWAEQTYQAEYNGNWKLAKKFGGQNVDVSDDFSNGTYEHYTKVNTTVYNGSSLDFGFSFDVVVNVKDYDEDGASGTGRSAQGTLRQFLESARAISGADRSYFVFKDGYSNQIEVNQDLWMYGGSSYNKAGHPSFVVTDSTHLDGKILDWNLNPRGDEISIHGIGCSKDCLMFLATGDNVTMENMKIHGNTVTVPDTGIRGIRLSGITNSLFKNLEIYDCHIGLELYWNAKNNQIINIESHNNTHSGIYFYWVTGSHNTNNVVKNCKLYNNKYTGIGLYYDSDYNVIDSNEIYNNGWAGIWIGYSCDYNEIKNNHAYNNSVSGILISANQGNAAKHNTIEDNIVENNGGFWDATVNYDSGIGLCYANDNIIRNNVIKNNYDTCGPVYGIALDGSSSGNLIENNEIFGNGVGINVVNSNSKNNTFSKNSIYNNYGLGIDLGNDGVTPNDGVLNSDKANYGVDFPVITTAKLIGNQLYVKGFINDESANNGSSSFANAIVEIFLVKNSINGDNLVGNNYNGKNYGEGWIYLGSLTADGNGNFNGYIDVSGKGIDSQSLISATTTLNGKGTSEFGSTIKTQVKVDVVKIDNPDPAKVNDVLKYTINVSNRGNTQLNVIIKDILDENTTYISSSHSGAYHALNHTVIWFLNLNPLESKIIKLNVSVKDVPNSILRNHVAIYSDGDILNETWQNTTVLGADFSIEKSDSLDPVAPNANPSYTINVTNTGYVNASVVGKRCFRSQCYLYFFRSTWKLLQQ